MNLLEIIVLYIFGLVCVLGMIITIGMIYMAWPGDDKMAIQSMRMARNSFRAWKHSHPDAPLRKTLKRMTQASVEGFEMEIGIHTLPSIIVPMPKELARDSQKKIKKLRGK